MVCDTCFSYLLISFYSLLFSSCDITKFWAGAPWDEINENGGCFATKFRKSLRRDELPTMPFSSRHVNTSHVSDIMCFWHCEASWVLMMSIRSDSVGVLLGRT